MGNGLVLCRVCDGAGEIDTTGDGFRRRLRFQILRSRVMKLLNHLKLSDFAYLKWRTFAKVVLDQITALLNGNPTNAKSAEISDFTVCAQPLALLLF